MRDKPTGLDEDQLIATLLEGWGMRVESAEYLPVGAGSYHWSVADRNGIVRFAKIDDLSIGEAAARDVFSSLRQSLATALSLHRDAGLEFVVAPIPAKDAAPLRRLNPRYALSVFPMVDGNAADFGPHRREDLAEMVNVLAALHRATPVVAHLAPRTDPAATRPEAAARGAARPGPPVDRWAACRGGPQAPDPSPRTDPCMVGGTEATRHTVTPAAVALYRRRWVLADVAAFTDDLRRPQGDGEDATAALAHLTGYLETITG